MQLRSAFDAGAAQTECADPVVGFSMSVSRYPWRISPAWSVIAGAIAGAGVYLEGGALLRLFAAVLLAELAWGVLLRLGARGRNEHNVGSGVLYLPYARPAAPIGRISDALAMRNTDGSVRSGWHDLGMGLALTGALSLVLGPSALLLSLLAIGAGATAWLLCGHKLVAALPLALLSVGLPWLLGAGLDVGGPAELLRLDPEIYLFAAAFTVLQWGALNVGGSSRGAPALLWLGQALVILAAVRLGLPWFTIVLAALLLVPTLRTATRDRTHVKAETLLAASFLWWWSAMMLAAIALRLSGAPAG